MQEFDIFLQGRRLVYDALFQSRLLEADIILRTLTFRDSLTITSRMAVMAAVSRIEMRKMLSASSKISVESDITATRETKFTEADSKIGIDAEAGTPTLKYGLHTAGSHIGVDSGEVDTLASVMASVANKIGISISDIDSVIRALLKSGPLYLGISSSCAEDQKRAMETIHSAVCVGADAEKILKKGLEQFENRLALSVFVSDIFYTFYTAAHDDLAISASIDDVLVRGSLGSAFAELGVESAVADTEATKYISASIEAGILCAAEIYGEIAISGESKIGLSAYAAEVLRRYRRLYEFDGDTLADMDGMTLDELSYIEV